jgi:hypothetical protein
MIVVVDETFPAFADPDRFKTLVNRPVNQALETIVQARHITATH